MRLGEALMQMRVRAIEEGIAGADHRHVLAGVGVFQAQIEWPSRKLEVQRIHLMHHDLHIVEAFRAGTNKFTAITTRKITAR